MRKQTPEKVDLHEARSIPLRALQTRRAQFLAEMDRLLPWERWERAIHGQCQRQIKGRPPYPVPVLLRLWFVQHWLHLSDPGMIDMATDSMAVREFAGFGLTWVDLPPDEDTWRKFRRLLDRTGLRATLESDVERRLRVQGWRMRLGEISEAGLVAVAG